MMNITITQEQQQEIHKGAEIIAKALDFSVYDVICALEMGEVLGADDAFILRNTIYEN